TRSTLSGGGGPRWSHRRGTSDNGPGGGGCQRSGSERMATLAAALEAAGVPSRPSPSSSCGVPSWELTPGASNSKKDTNQPSVSTSLLSKTAGEGGESLLLGSSSIGSGYAPQSLAPAAHPPRAPLLSVLGRTKIASSGSGGSGTVAQSAPHSSTDSSSANH
ncbi:unnamed protein product, partial [Discosporangium mesarthrocarpum]